MNLLIFSICFILSLRYGGTLALDVAHTHFEIRAVAFVTGTGAIYFLLYALKNYAVRFFKRLFKIRSRSEKGVENLQRALSEVLLKNEISAAKSIRKAKNYLGEIPMVMWLEGQIDLLKGNESEARAIFNSLRFREKDTALGAFSLCKCAFKKNDDKDILNAIDSVLAISAAPGLSSRALAISILNKNFVEAEKYLSQLKDSKKYPIFAAIFFAELGKFTQDAEQYAKAFKLCPQISPIAVEYANLLKNEKEYRHARKILGKSFEICPTLDLFDAYTNCGEDLTSSDRLDFAQKLLKIAPNSWIVHYGIGNLARQNDMPLVALKHFSAAYSLCSYAHIFAAAKEIAENFPDPKPEEAAEFSDKPNPGKSVCFCWRCSECNHDTSSWLAVCPYCFFLGTYEFIAKEHRGALSAATLIAEKIS